MKRALIGAVAGAALAATAAHAQAVSVFGNAIGHECYRAASYGHTGLTAIQACDEAIDSSSLIGRDLAATHVNRGIVRAARGDLDGAQADYAEARRLRPGLPESYIGEGNTLFLMSDFAGALEAYDTALSNGIKAAHAAHFNRGLTLEHMGRLDEAEAAYEQAALLAPEWNPPRAHIARIHDRRAAQAAAPPTN